MHFGKQLERDCVQEWRAHYVDFKQLKRCIKQMVLAASSMDSESIPQSADVLNPAAGNASASGVGFDDTPVRGEGAVVLHEDLPAAVGGGLGELLDEIVVRRRDM